MNRTTMMGAALAALVAVTGGVALAQSGEGMMRGEGMMQGQGGTMERGPRGDGPMAAFERFDADGDGRVTAAEVEAFRTARFAEFDADGDGQVSRQEFMDHAAARAGERAGGMFDRLDADGDGILSRDALEARRGSWPGGERMIERFDADGDGAVTQEEIAGFREEMRGRFSDRMGRHERGERRMMDGWRGGRHNDG